MNSITIPVNRKTITLAALALLALALTFLAGCGLGKATEPFNDSGVGQHLNGNADVGNMPDGVNNWASKCAEPGIRVFTIYHGDSAYGAIAAVPDKTCKVASTGGF